MTTKRDEYIKLKTEIAVMQKAEMELRNLVQAAENEAHATAEPLHAAYRLACDQATRAVRVRFTEQLNEARELRYKIADAQRLLNTMPECDHAYSNDTSALQRFFPYGGDPGDKPMVRCTICEETWT